MIYFLVTDRKSSNIRRMLRKTSELRGTLCYLTYEELFFEECGPLGHYVFSDIDRMSRYELETASTFARALREAAPAARLLNDPAVALDRTPLLAALHRAGINDFTAARLDVGVRPSRYPVFIRTEDGHYGPETDLLNDEAEFDAALDSLRARGLPLRGRIVVEYAGKPHADGRFRKYSAYNIGGRIFGDELFVSDNWAVKDAVATWQPGIVAEELDFVRTNPHRAELERAFAVGRIDYGRADYAVIDGKVQVYEVNTNPKYAIRLIDDERAERRRLARQMTIDAFRAIDTPLDASGRVAFARSRPRPHRFHLPLGMRLVKSAGRLLRDGVIARATGRTPGQAGRAVQGSTGR